MRTQEDILALFDQNASLEEYSSFKELSENEEEGANYFVHTVDRRSDVTILAPHGGNIEPYTLDLATELSHGRYNLYGFQAIGSTKGMSLHLTSHRFDDPRALRLVGQSSKVLSFHGLRDTDEVVEIGGRDVSLGRRISDSLARAGFSTRKTEKRINSGISATNIVNMGKTKAGVQIEIGLGLLLRLRDNGYESFCWPIIGALKD